MKQLKIYFTSDMHGYVFPTDYRDHEDKSIGMLKLISNFDKDGNTIILDGGDTIQGSPFTTYLSKFHEPINPIATIFNEAGYDFVTLGNHEFNYGFDYLKSYMLHLDAKCLCTNVQDNSNSFEILPYSIKTLENGLKVGVVGFTTDFIPIWEKPDNITNFTVVDTFQSVKKAHDEIRDKVDILIGLYHGGFECDVNTGKVLSTSPENIGYKVCQQLDFDILLTGHQHMSIPPTLIKNTYVVQPGHYCTNYVFIDAQINDDNKIASISGDLYTIGNTVNQKLFDKFSPLQQKIQNWLDKDVGHLDIALPPNQHLDMALHGTYLANFINQVQLDRTGADISTTSLANSIKGFNQSVTIRDIVSTYVFSNTLAVIEVTGDIIKQALEVCARYFDVSGDKVSVDKHFTYPKVCHYNYDYFSGINYVFDTTKPVGERVTSIKFKGTEITPDQKFTLALNNYRATGVGDYSCYKGCPVVSEVLTDFAEIIIDYFTKYTNVTVDKTKYYEVLLP
ncbi:MAG: bifunctional metallophosphatase/5'-nucleotidase [Epulopiscium sp. Nele67-Bin004]|nr:MAG: bifunctional metallophosphatase/5'-nucleotidase [Epulopiscium sp. Nele67-Bin004]